MAKDKKAKAVHEMWALFNFDTVFHVGYTRGECVKAGIEALGSEAKYEKYRRSGAFKVERVTLRRTASTKIDKP